MEKLNPKHEKFAQLYVQYGNASKAYREAIGSEAKPESVHVEACKLKGRPNVGLRIKQIQDDLEAANLWSRVDSVKALKDVAMEGEKDSDKVQAVKALNSMYGWDKQVVDHQSSDGTMAPKSAVEVSEETLSRLLDKL